MRTAVLGATGRTGQSLVEQARERGHGVAVFVRDLTDLPSRARGNDRVRNVAAFILDCLEGDRYVHEMPKVADR